MDTQQFSACFAKAANCMQLYVEELCKLDSGIGDGDHGVTIARGFDAAKQAVLVEQHSPSDVLMAASEAMGRSMGGAIGPIYQAYWKDAAKALQAGKSIGEALEDGAHAAMRVGMAQPGEKTVVDAMLPCAQAAKRKSDLVAALVAGAEAATEGANTTIQMQAKKGRAKFLREKSLGFIDPGAKSFALFMGAWAQQASTIENDKETL